MSYAFPPPVPLSISVTEFLLHLCIESFALAATCDLLPPSKQMPRASLRHRMLSIAILVAAIGAYGLRWPTEYFIAWDAIFVMLAVARLSLRLLRRGFSQVSFAVAMLVGIGLVWVTAIRPAYNAWYDSLYETQPRSRCNTKIRNLAIAMQNIAEAQGRKFPDLVAGGPGQPSQTWRVQALPYLDRGDLDGAYSPEFNWDSPENSPMGGIRVQVFNCHENRFPTDAFGRYFTAFAAITGPLTIFPDQKGIRMDRITDGTSHTILIGECSGLNIVWTEPRDIDVSKQKLGINMPGDRLRFSSSILSSYHPGGAHVAFADGSVKFLSEKIDPKVLKALTTATGGENVSDDGTW